MNIGDWPVLRQIRTADKLAPGQAVISSATSEFRLCTSDADRSAAAERLSEGWEKSSRSRGTPIHP
jgi:hypothetical protein